MDNRSGTPILNKLTDPHVKIINSTQPCSEKLPVAQLGKNLPVRYEALKAVTTEDHASEMWRR
jgi:hypothetical protein